MRWKRLFRHYVWHIVRDTRIHRWQVWYGVRRKEIHRFRKYLNIKNVAQQSATRARTYYWVGNTKTSYWSYCIGKVAVSTIIGKRMLHFSVRSSQGPRSGFVRWLSLDWIGCALCAHSFSKIRPSVNGTNKKVPHGWLAVRYVYDSSAAGILRGWGDPHRSKHRHCAGHKLWKFARALAQHLHQIISKK